MPVQLVLDLFAPAPRAVGTSSRGGSPSAARCPAARRLCRLRLRDDRNGCDGGRDRLARADPTRSRTGSRRRATRGSSAHRGRSPPRRRPCTASRTRTSRRLRRSPTSPTSCSRLLDGRGLRGAQRDFDLGDATACVRPRGIAYRPAAVACTLEAFRLLEPLAENHRLQSICERRGIALDDAHEAMSDVLATVALLRVLLDEGIAPETVELDHSAYMRLRSRGDTRPASEPQIRRVFGLARSAGLVLPDGNADRDRVVALVERVTGTAEVDALTRAQVQDVYDALEELIEQAAARARRVRVGASAQPPARTSTRTGWRRRSCRSAPRRTGRRRRRARPPPARCRDWRSPEFRRPRPRRSRTAARRQPHGPAHPEQVTGDVVLDLDRARANVDQQARLGYPRQPQHGLAAELAGQDRGQRLPLLLAAALVHVDDEAPRRPRLVVVVANHERGGEAASSPRRPHGRPRRARRVPRSRYRASSAHPCRRRPSGTGRSPRSCTTRSTSRGRATV